MQISRAFQLLLLIIVCLWTAVTGAPPNTPCLKNRRNTSLVASAMDRAYLSPSVFLGTLKSVLVQRDSTVRAWFSIHQALKPGHNVSRTAGDTEVIYHRTCDLELKQDALKLGSQYLVFGSPSSSRRSSWPSLMATALPIPNEKRTLRAVKRVLCKGCAKAAGVSGLQRLRLTEGERVRLQCHLAGNPIPWIEWYKDGQRVASKRRLRVMTKRRTSRLVIRKARLADRGVYECRAGNVLQRQPAAIRATLTVSRRRPPTTTPAATTTQSSPWTTEPCPLSDFCLNGGTCVFYKVVREYVCQCAEGYVGLRCDFKDVSVSVGGFKNYSFRGDIP